MSPHNPHLLPERPASAREAGVMWASLPPRGALFPLAAVLMALVVGLFAPHPVHAASPPDAPAGLVVARGGDGELIAEWQAPSDDGGSAITGYQLRHSRAGSAWTTVPGTVTGQRWAVIGSLTNGDEYRIQVRAVNKAGAGDWSASGHGTPAARPIIRVEQVVTGVSKPWGLAFAADGTMMFTERGGRLKVRLVDGTVRTVNADFSDIGADWETGLMGMVVDPDFDANRHFYTCQGHQDPNTNATSVQVIKWKMNGDYTAAARVKDPLVGGVGIRIGNQWQHAGCRLRFGPQGHLWIATGDGYANKINPQDITNLNGKMLRVHKDTGEGVAGNPYYDHANANSKRVYTYGHRNPQGLALRPGTGQMWSVEHGTDRNDEINLLAPGGNYGYAPQGHTTCGPDDDKRTISPNVYCIDAPMTDLDRFPDAVEARWSSGHPTLATSGGIFLEGEQWGAWEGRLAVATLRTRSVRLFTFTPEGSFVGQFSVPELAPFNSRLRTPMMGPDGALYITTSDNTPGETNFQSNDESIDRILRVYVYDAQADATLTGLRLSGSDGSAVPLSPRFATGVLRYGADVASDVTAVTVAPVLSRAGATVTVNGNDPSAAVSLDPGPNTIAVRVTAQDGATTRDYTVTVTRQGSSHAGLTGLDISGTVMRDGEAVSVWLFSNPWFDPTTASYTVRVPSDLQSISFAPSWTDDAITAVVLHERASAEHSTQGGNEAARTAASGARLTSGSNPRYPAVEVVAGDGDPLVHYFNLERVSLSFGGATVEDMTFTAGAEVPRRGLTQDEVLDLRLPRATGGFYNVTYTVTGLPAGLHLGQGRTIRGTPEAATTSPATVTYTATDETGASASLTFQVSVAPPLAFDAEQRQAYKDTIFEYTVGQAERIVATLPEATGGHGALTYHLTYRVRTATGSAQKSIDDDAPGFSFDAATRVLSSDTGASAPSAAAFYSVNYWVEDENGARAAASNSIAVNEAPTLRTIADQRFTVGKRVSLTLPGAVGGTQVGTGILYRLEPAVAGLVFNARQHLRSLTGTPHVPGTTEVTYTATDRNRVSATRTFAVTVVNGPSAPASAPSSLQAAQAYSGADPDGSGAAAVWDTVPGATGYVVQVRADGGSYPDLAVDSAPARVNLSLPNVDTGLVWINAISTGDYRVRVAARNAHGVGPWSQEVGFTVSALQSQPQVGGQCDTCGTEGELGVVVRSKSPHAELIARMREWRNDPQWVHAKPHTDRWDRALLAFGETVSDSSLTAMTAAEAQGFAERGWERWVSVAAALREIEAGAQLQQAPQNRAPTVSAALADATIVHESGTLTVPLAGVFEDADGDALSISVSSSTEAVATVSAASDGSSLTLEAQAQGGATITVTADDGQGGTVSDAFTVTVKAAPQVATALADVSGLEAGATQEVSLSEVFSDADGDALALTAVSDDEGVATVSVAAGGSSLTVTAVAAGTATVTVTARDADGNAASEAFDISVVEAAGTAEGSGVVARYDANGNGAIDVPEYIQARRDYAYGRLGEAGWEEILSAWLASAYGS